jgi:hypothetical protein
MDAPILLPIERLISPDGLLTFVVYQDEGDIVLGFEGFEWHTHADLLASWMGIPQDEAVRRFVDDLTEGRATIAIHTVNGEMCDVCITDDPNSDLNNKSDDESIAFRHWDGSSVLPTGAKNE